MSNKAPGYKFDDTLKIGDKVSNHYNGTICVITDIAPQKIEDAYSAKLHDANIGDFIDPHVTVRKICTASHKMVKGKSEETFSGSYMTRLDNTYFDARIKEHMDAVERIEIARQELLK